MNQPFRTNHSNATSDAVSVASMLCRIAFCWYWFQSIGNSL